MRGLLGRVGLRVAIAAGLLLLILGVVAVARVAGGSGRDPLVAPPEQTPSAVDPTAGDDAEIVATPSAYADTAQVIAAAKAFTAAWLRRDLSPEAWHAGITPLSTETLAESLQGVDPLGVPATRTTNDPTIVRRTELFAQVTTVVDTGTLELTLSKPGSKWLVDGVDWERA